MMMTMTVMRMTVMRMMLRMCVNVCWLREFLAAV